MLTFRCRNTIPSFVKIFTFLGLLSFLSDDCSENRQSRTMNVQFKGRVKLFAEKFESWLSSMEGQKKLSYQKSERSGSEVGF